MLFYLRISFEKARFYLEFIRFEIIDCKNRIKTKSNDWSADMNQSLVIQSIVFRIICLKRIFFFLFYFLFSFVIVFVGCFSVFCMRNWTKLSEIMFSIASNASNSTLQYQNQWRHGKCSWFLIRTLSCKRSMYDKFVMWIRSTGWNDHFCSFQHEQCTLIPY